ncbi:SLC13 family permease [Sphingosinicella sp. BN140058]|uniref:SLC13 family permease n=1 Tax=Sphingosinicella sp. BN140058 TaxID=1892855 RepID=UPI0010132134|nr:SLC13 family permease [Sphingosinicella sp. BN140058]QAY75963.1 SLC13 family permease [Sphingosinicella sp. BN140058]
MTTPQMLAFAVLGGMMLLFVWGRIRFDLVAILALLTCLAVGIVKPKEAFTGFSDDIVIIVASALVISAAVERSGVIEVVLSRLAGGTTRFGTQLSLLVGSVTILSALVKNIGALAMMMPAAFQMAKKSNSSPSCMLMPMSFGSLLGGLITFVGTSPNIIVSRVREEMTGQPFSMFDYTPVGLGLAAAGFLFLRFGYRLLPAGRRAAPTMGEALDIEDYATEAEVPARSAAEGLTVGQFRDMVEGEIAVTGIHRYDGRSAMPLPDAVISAGDILTLKGDPDALERAISVAGLELEGQHRQAAATRGSSNVGVIEAVVGRDSVLAGQAAGRMALHERHGVNLIAVSRRGERITARLRDIVLCPGDVIVLQGPLDTLPERLRELGCLPLAERQLRLGAARRGLIPIAILAVAMALTALGVLPVAIAFFGAAALIMLAGALPAREAYERIEWPILIMIGALIPVSDSLRTTGATDLIAHWLSAAAATLPAWGAVGLILVAAMAVTPFLNNAATVLVMAPIAATFASGLGYRPEAFLMAVAVGAGSDFLTPIGHQCNTLVMGPGGYRFSDYARLGAPLSLMVVIVGVPLILAVWPLR